MTSDVFNVIVLDAASCTCAGACDVIAAALRIGVKLAVVDVVFERELRGRGGDRLARRGLRVESLADVRPAIALRRGHPYLSLGDAFSVALAAANRSALLTSSPLLAKLAEERGIAVRDFRYLLEHPQLVRPPARVSYPRSRYGLVA
jgi:hypothetical protein